MTTSQAPYPPWIYRQSAVVPYRWNEGQLEVLLISSSGGKRWVVPKGIIEPGLSATASAAIEAAQEAGVEGVVGEVPLGTYRYKKWGGTCEVEVFPMWVHRERAEWPESDVRRRRWLPVDEAAREVGRKKLRKLVAGLPRVVGSAQERPVSGSSTQAAVSPRLVYLFRHAKSSWANPELDDFDRPLAPRGERACAIMAEYMRLADIHPDLVACSGALRTRQTLERVRPALGDNPMVKHFRGLYLADPQAMLNGLRLTTAYVRRVMLIGHNPGMQSLAQRLVGSGADHDLRRLSEKFPTGALAILVFRGRSWRELDEGSCELHSLVMPRDLDVGQ